MKKETREARETAGLIDNWDRSLPQQNNNPTKSVLERILFVVLNAVVVALLAIHFLLYSSLHEGEDPLGLIITYPAAVAFLITGGLLIVLRRFLRISALGLALPFIAILYTLPASIIVASTLQFGLVHWVAAFICVLLVALIGYTTVRSLL